MKTLFKSFVVVALLLFPIFVLNCSSDPVQPCAACTSDSDCDTATMACVDGKCTSKTNQWTCNKSEKSTDESGPSEFTKKDAGVQDNMPKEEVEEIATIGEVGKPDRGLRCDGKIAKEWPFNTGVVGGGLRTDAKGNYNESIIDATAGGYSQARKTAFIYLDLDTGKKVDVDDFQAVTDSTWELAFKRTSLRTNSGDSGPGQTSLTKVANTTFDAVTSIPTSTYFKDISFDQNCQVVSDPLGSPQTAVNYLNLTNKSGSKSWYNYGGGGGMSVVPNKGDVYVLKGSDQGKTYKFEIVKWQSGVYTLKWAELK